MQPRGKCIVCETDYGPLRRPSGSNLGSRQFPVSLSETGITPNIISTLVDGAHVDNLKMAMVVMFGETHDLNKDKISAFLLLLYEMLRRFPVRAEPIHLDQSMSVCLILDQLLTMKGPEPGAQLLLVQLQVLLPQVFNILKRDNTCFVACGDAEGTQEDPEFVTPPPWRYTEFMEYVMELLRLCKQ
jgi:hypothetical protein